MLKRLLVNALVPLSVLVLNPDRVMAQDGAAEPVVVIFSPDMQRADLDRITAEVKAQGIDLDIDRARYKDGLLHTIAFSVRTPGGSGTASGELRPDRRLGFRYDPRPGVKTVFSVGNLQ